MSNSRTTRSLLVTQKHVTRMQEYCFSDDWLVSVMIVPNVAEAAHQQHEERREALQQFANSQRRLQIRTLVLFLARLSGSPELDELLSLRHVNTKLVLCDPDGASPDVPGLGESGEGNGRTLLLRSGPDCNGRMVIFTALEHRLPNECCLNALTDLLVYEQHAGVAQSLNDLDFASWMRDPRNPSPFLFHKVGEPYSPLNKREVKSDIESALRFVGAPVCTVEAISEGAVEFMVQKGIPREEAETRILAPPMPPMLSPFQIRTIQSKEYRQTFKIFTAVMLQSAAWKLQHFEERWPLAGLDCIQARETKRFFRQIMRHVQDTLGCARCGIKQTADGNPHMKCGKCRTQLYCSRECQVADWKRHKRTECKTILLSNPKTK